MEKTTFDSSEKARKAEASLEDIAKLALLESAINEAVWIMEPAEGEGEGKWYYSNSIAKLCGYSKPEIIAMPQKHLSLILFDDYAEIKKELADFYKSKVRNKLILNYRLTRNDESVIWIKEEITKLEDELITGVLTDVTQIKQLNNSINDYDRRIKELNTAKDSFITILSHDLRAPFTSILGFAEILMNEQNLPVSEKNEYLTYIYEASQNQLQLINYLLDWSRLQTGKLNVEPQRLRAQVIVFNCVSSLTGNAIRKNVEISVNVDEEIYINADERLITQAVTNLLSNAIKFSKQNSKVEVSVNNFNSAQVEFVIRDSGIGISDEDQSKLFKVENMFTTEGTAGEKGSGLGLPLVKEIVEKHGGEIWFYSQHGSGSEFHFTVPKPLNTVLIVDSSPAEREFLQTIVKRSLPEYSILTAENGFEAMSIILEGKPTLIVTDHDLPLMNGLQLIESIKKGNALLKIPFVVITKDDAPDLRNEYFAYGVSTVLPKPVDIEEFSKIIQDIVV